MPLGNGRIGAMQFGGVEWDRIGLNEDSLWSGAPSKDGNNGRSPDPVPERRRCGADDGFEVSIR
ncbi:glycoside hydrolase N-terminal domain-containing protein [Paenibacillus sp. LHD-117]|uniref:glycoside hydrolase N-terminal domain-containing protein n=1 Tax=Paenibacillus sp. LHD-117 TaxID=3071412 RepID=UPI0035A8B7F5